MTTDHHDIILVVDDEPFLRELIRRVVEKDGYRVLVAEDGASAVEVWKEHSAEIDLLLTDMVMPGGMTGLALGKQLQAERQDLPVIYTSGHSAEIIDNQSSCGGKFTFLQKPYDPRTLLNLIRASLSEREAVAA